jgi:hypothetical protein
MSFALTTQQVREETKTVTRRFAWWFLKPGSLLMPVEKSMGLKKGERIVYLRDRPLQVISTRREMLVDITDQECLFEGFPNMNSEAFIEMLAEHYKKKADWLRWQQVNRIEFVYL